jgi:hypothetical protein
MRRATVEITPLIAPVPTHMSKSEQSSDSGGALTRW